MLNEPKKVSNGQEKLRASVLVFVAVLLFLYAAMAYILFRLYQTSSQLVDARRSSFVQECSGKAAILDEYLAQRINDLQSILASQPLSSYYHSKSLGMSKEYGLSIAIESIDDEFNKLQKTVKSDNYLVFKGLAFFDIGENRVIAKSLSFEDISWIDKQLFDSGHEIMKFPGGGLGFVSRGNKCSIFLFSAFRYRDQDKGYLLLELEPDAIGKKIQLTESQTEDNFSGLVDANGIIFLGPHALVGKNLASLAILPASFPDDGLIESTWPGKGQEESTSVIIAMEKSMNGAIHLLTVAPRFRYLAGHTYSLWVAIVAILMGGLLVGLALIRKSYSERQEFYRQLSDAYGSLERRVEERTADLAKTNENLLKEIDERERAQEALKQSEEKYRQFVENANDIIYRTDSNGNFSFVNPVALRIFGYDLEDLIGKHFSELIPEENVAEVRKFYESQLANRRSNTYYEFPATRKDGSVIWIGQNVQFLSEDKQVMGFQAIARNITDRKRTEDELRWKEALLRHMSSSSPLAYLVVDHKTDRILYFNNRFCEIWGIQSLEYPIRQGKIRNSDLIAIFAGMVKEPQTFSESCVSLQSADERRILEDEIDLVDGRTIRRFSAEIRDDKDNYWGRFYIYEDITDRRKAMETLRLANEFQKRLLSTAATAIVTVDAERRITSVNDEFCLITGFNPDEIIGQPCTIFAIEPCQSKCSLFSPERSGPIFRQHCLVKSKNGQVLTILKNADLMVDESGKIVGGIESFIDVTELIAAREKALAANVAKSAFLANMSHEIRTPMNGIIGMTELALNTSLTHEQREYLDLVMISADSLLKIINDVLDFSKIEAGKIDLEFLDFNLREYLEDLVRTLSVQARAKDIEVACHVLPDVPQLVIGDYERLRQIVVNIMSNAIKFTQSGEVVLRVENFSIREDEVVLHFTIADSGIGIPHERLEKIFQPFEQVDATTTRKFGGTGLGLAIASRLVEMMGGRIWVESELGKGSVFHFSGRFGIQKMRKKSVVPSEIAGLKNVRVLAVDDNATNRAILMDTLVSWDMAPTMVEGGLQALEVIRQSEIDNLLFALILLDVQMPGMDGVELALPDQT